jgi:NAD(P)H-dependent FMN reductase
VGRQAGRGQPGWKVDLIDLAELPLAVNLGASAGTAELATRISDTAAILLVTCEYNHGYPASPKLAQQLLSPRCRHDPGRDATPALPDLQSASRLADAAGAAHRHRT